jgi:hypothetical protein
MNEIEAGTDAIKGKTPCDCPDCPDCADKAAKASLAESGPDNSRRKLLFGGVVATPAVLLLSSRPVLATGGGGYRGCTASANASVNLSKPQQVTCKGLSPGCWKETLKWPSLCKPGLPDPCGGGWSTHLSVTYSDLKAFFKQKYKCSNSTAGSMAQAFKNHNALAGMFSNIVPMIPGNGLSMMQALHYGNEVQKHAAAAFLNAAFFTKAQFGYTVQELHDMIVARYGSDKAQLENDLVWLGGHRGGSCPQDGDGDKYWKIDWPKVLNVSV